jgi:hypothetical protein
LKKAEQVLTGRGRGEMTQTMYTHVSKCKNDIIKGDQEKDFRIVKDT